jgi:hypothetical protein
VAIMHIHLYNVPPKKHPGSFSNITEYKKTPGLFLKYYYYCFFFGNRIQKAVFTKQTGKGRKQHAKEMKQRETNKDDLMAVERYKTELRAAGGILWQNVYYEPLVLRHAKQFVLKLFPSLSPGADPRQRISETELYAHVRPLAAKNTDLSPKGV